MSTMVQMLHHTQDTRWKIQAQAMAVLSELALGHPLTGARRHQPMSGHSDNNQEDQQLPAVASNAMQHVKSSLSRVLS